MIKLEDGRNCMIVDEQGNNAFPRSGGLLGGLLGLRSLQYNDQVKSFNPLPPVTSEYNRVNASHEFD